MHALKFGYCAAGEDAGALLLGELGVEVELSPEAVSSLLLPQAASDRDRVAATATTAKRAVLVTAPPEKIFTRNHDPAGRTGSP